MEPLTTGVILGLSTGLVVGVIVYTVLFVYAANRIFDMAMKQQVVVIDADDDCSGYESYEDGEEDWTYQNYRNN